MHIYIYIYILRHRTPASLSIIAATLVEFGGGSVLNVVVEDCCMAFIRSLNDDDQLARTTIYI